jgi:subtilisin family serine protease
MKRQDHPIKSANLSILMKAGIATSLIVSLLSGLSAAEINTRTNSLSPELLKKVTKQQPSTLTNTESKSAFNMEELDSQFSSWGISSVNSYSSINLADAWKRYKQKKEIVVAVIDTGIDPTHPYFENNIFVKSGSSSAQNFGVDFSKGRAHMDRPTDSHGHGTHVSGIVRSVHPGVKILSLKYYNPSASGQDNLNSTIEALKYAVDQNVDIINYSGGGPEPALEELRILKLAEKKGILVVAAAGNEESNIDNKNNAYYPASYGLSNIITITAHDQDLKILSSSNYGAKSVDISAPGYRIKSALPGGRAGFLTGTSQATAFVSGVAALIKGQHPETSAPQIKKIIMDSAKREASLVGKCSTAGRLDAAKALESADIVNGHRNIASN